MSEDYKYEIGTKVTTKRELVVECIDGETGEGYEVTIPEGWKGEIESCGRSSVYGMKEMYDIEFVTADSEETITFFLDDLEDIFVLEVGSGE
ncbi:hypothetical protein [Priestia megaterium]|uniref:hypothetical protein n=1 Tax=Priestia megaterium TaxID=1404 RepID=UPI00300ABF3D